nr:hypothetical protein [Angustibacter aerolatus]
MTASLGSVFSDRRVGGDRKAEPGHPAPRGQGGAADAAPRASGRALAPRAAVRPRARAVRRAWRPSGASRLVARVIVPIPLEEAHRERLAAALRRQFGKPVQAAGRRRPRRRRRRPGRDRRPGARRHRPAQAGRRAAALHPLTACTITDSVHARRQRREGRKP